MLKAKFSGPDAATTAITAMMKKRPLCKGKTTWCKHDQPILKRAPLSFLFGLKKELVNWDVPKACTYIDEESATMQVEGAPVLHVCSKEGQLKLNWLDDAWAKWHELQAGGNFVELKAKWDSILKSVGAKQSKGAGKGPASGSSQ